MMSPPEAPDSQYVVIKLGGEVIASPFMAALAADVAAMRARGECIVLVHGGGPQATELQTRLGQTPRIVGGRRITDADALDVITMVVAGKINVMACSALLAAGAMPVGLHGASALVVRAEKRPPRVVTGCGPEPVDFGHVGDVTGVNRELVALLCGGGYVPVVACVGASADGLIYNINADAVAHRVAVELRARALVLVSDVRGVLRDVGDPASRIPHLSAKEARYAIATGVVTQGMIPKLDESLAALAKGVRAVHIVGRLGRGELESELNNPGSIGTVVEDAG